MPDLIAVVDKSGQCWTARIGPAGIDLQYEFEGGDILAWVGEWTKAGEVTVVLPCVNATEDDLRDTLAGQGWITPRSTSGWYRSPGKAADGPEGVARHGWTLGIRDRAEHDPMIGADQSTADILTSLYSWRGLTGGHYRHTPGASTILLIIDTVRDKARLVLQDRATTEWWQPPAGIRDIRWPSGHPISHGHQFDMRSAYLAAAAAVSLPAGRLRQTGYDTDGHSPGYYLVRNVRYGAAILDAYGAAILDALGFELDEAWLCHPTLALLREEGCTPEIIDSWTAPSAGRLLRPWAERWRDLMATPDLDPHLRTVLKRGYAEAIGLMGAQTNGIYRPDWRHMIIDQVRASLLRRVINAAYGFGLPYKIDVDSVWYHSGASTTLLGDRIGVGEHIGQMRYEGVQPL
jgi:hypothetical protein